MLRTGGRLVLLLVTDVARFRAEEEVEEKLDGVGLFEWVCEREMALRLGGILTQARIQ